MAISSRSRRIIIYFIVIDAVLLLGILVARPIVVGYTVYSQMKGLNQSLETYTQNINDVRTEMMAATGNLSSCYSMNQQLLEKLQEDNSRILDYQNQASSLERELGNLKDSSEKEKNEIQQKLDEKTADMNSLKESYDSLVRNTANNFCCKARIDNPKIKYYEISGDKVVCLESGTLEISCTL